MTLTSCVVTGFLVLDAGDAGSGDGVSDLGSSSAALVSSETSWTAGNAPEELEERMPTDLSDREEPRTVARCSCNERSEKEIANDAMLRSGVVGGEILEGGLHCVVGEALDAALGFPDSSSRKSAGSELEWPTRICPERKDEDCDLLPNDLWDEVCEDRPRERCDDVFLYVDFRSLLQRGQNVALMNQMSTHRAWKTCAQSSTRQMSGTVALNASWQIAHVSCL
eukprot:CAMPEP_0172827206 /NCGR_PEP_ID=MMETSP1075-20121228/19952_1 /TAXON_ID=2916 /ORGANISM="Ceratium fusus, Strain PA161109" /LENGTH=223 /DNA_ID=CAMNT_0013668983 /DNA_START=952 /DNA_END=1624 /DNA_ORIENTATION=+